MPDYIIKLTDNSKKHDYYLLWSTVVDAPLIYGLSLDDFKKWYIEKFGSSSITELKERLERVEKTGCSGYPPFDSFNELLSLNRAGKKGEHLSKKMIIENYCFKNQ